MRNRLPATILALGLGGLAPEARGADLTGPVSVQASNISTSTTINEVRGRGYSQSASNTLGIMFRYEDKIVYGECPDAALEGLTLIDLAAKEDGKVTITLGGLLSHHTALRTAQASHIHKIEYAGTSVVCVRYF